MSGKWKPERPDAPPGADDRIALGTAVALGVVASGLVIWAARNSVWRLRPPDAIPAFALVASVAAVTVFAAGKALARPGTSFNAVRAVAAEGFVLGLLAVAAWRLVPVPDPLLAMPELPQDPLSLAVQKAAERAQAGAPSEPYVSPQLEEAVDTGRQFFHAWLSGDRDRMKAFAVPDLQGPLTTAQLPPPVITDVAAVPLTEIRVLGHQQQGKRMTMKVAFGDREKELALAMDVGWLVAELP